MIHRDDRQRLYADPTDDSLLAMELLGILR